MGLFPKAKKTIIFSACFLVVCTLAAGGYFYWQAQKQPDLPNTVYREGDVLPEALPLIGIEGQKQSVGNFRGKVLLMNFWASWCGPCMEEMPSIYALSKRMAGQNFAAVGISMDENTKQGLQILKRVAGDVPFPLYRGVGEKISESFSFNGLPFSVVLDKSGKIIYARMGALNWSDPRVIQIIRKSM